MQAGRVHIYPARAVDDARERRDRRLDQGGQLGDMCCGQPGVAVELGDRLVGFGA